MDEKALPTYADLMAEIKLRTETIDTVLGRNLPLRQKVAEELCYLQLRMICESIAIGCLLVHGDISTKTLLGESKADLIINKLTGLHPKFYPEPLESGKDDVSPEGRFIWKERKDEYLSKADLVRLYRSAGGRLHCGSAKSVLKKRRPLEFKEIQDWRDKIVRLLTRHTLRSADEQRLFYVVMNQRGTGRVGWNVFQAMEAGQSVPKQVSA